MKIIQVAIKLIFIISLIVPILATYGIYGYPRSYNIGGFEGYGIAPIKDHFLLMLTLLLSYLFIFITCIFKELRKVEVVYFSYIPFFLSPLLLASWPYLERYLSFFNPYYVVILFYIQAMSIAYFIHQNLKSFN